MSSQKSHQSNNELPQPIDTGREAAANLVRQKVSEAYAAEPSAKAELAELAEDQPKHPSKHQQFLQDLQASGASIVEVQTRWHEYYAALPEAEKHAVWQEFYASQSDSAFLGGQSTAAASHADTKPKVSHAQHGHPVAHPIATPSARGKRLRDARTSKEIRESIKHKVSAGGTLKAKHHIQTLLVGLGAGVVTLFVLLFGLFNQMIIAPFIQPSTTVSNTPIIMDNASLAADGTNKIIIPKINVEIPVDYYVPSMAEADIQKGLENGVVHYPSTVMPGTQGNAAYFGHSSNNIFNPGDYKFAFVLLSKLDEGDMFYLTKDGQTYAYRVFKKQVVNPSDTWVLNAVEGKTATATLITCDPPGTTRYRLVVWGEQVSPDPGTAVATDTSSGTVTNAVASTTQLPGTAPSLWSRFVDWLF